VVIVNWNTLRELEECLRSVRKAGSRGTEVVVIDNASPDGSAEMVRRKFADVRLIENRENLGFAKAANHGISASHGRYVFLLNPDAEVHPGALAALVHFGDDNADVGIFGPKILNPDGSIQYSCRRFPTLAAGIFRNSFLGRLFANNPYTREYLMADWDHNEPRDVDWVSGAALVARRDLLDDVGPLDERFFMYCEDVDLAYRAKQKGWRVMYFPGATVVHARARSSDQDPNRMIAEFHKSMYRFFKKHYAAESSIVTRMLVPAGLFLRATAFITHNHWNRCKSGVARCLRRRLRPAREARRPKVIKPTDRSRPDEP